MARGLRRIPWAALGALVLGHAVSMIVVAWIALSGAAWRRETLLGWATALLLVTAFAARRAPRHDAARGAAKSAAVGLASFLVATAHASGLLLVPSLVPLCLGRS